MKIKQYKPKYLYDSEQEIDFIFNKTLLEVKYHRDIEKKQLVFFESYSIKNKFVVKNYRDLNAFLSKADLDGNS